MKLDLFNINSESRFNELALRIFYRQAENNPVYEIYLKGIGKKSKDIRSMEDIPFLPIELFKSHKIVTGNPTIQEVFSSSGTTGSQQSRHYVSDISLYKKSFEKCFNLFYGNPKDWIILALLPSYLERDGSSLVYMVDTLIKESDSSHSGFYLHNIEKLAKKLQYLDSKGKKVLLMGVTYSLLDLIVKYKFSLSNTTIMETGGMKGKRKEMIREELHEMLCKGFGVNKIHSEYGMTELLSQAYSGGDGIFATPPWMKVMIRDINDPFTLLDDGKTGGLNIIDLANINSCSFIATQDLGKKNNKGTFEVLGRFDNTDIRGCNLMIE